MRPKMREGKSIGVSLDLKPLPLYGMPAIEMAGKGLGWEAEQPSTHT